jgi:hypothetical protein
MDYFPVRHELLRFVIETGSVYCAVRTGSLNTGLFQIKLILNRITIFVCQAAELQ